MANHNANNAEDTVKNNVQNNTKDHSLQIEVLLHASEAPLTDKALKQHLSINGQK